MQIDLLMVLRAVSFAVFWGWIIGFLEVEKGVKSSSRESCNACRLVPATQAQNSDAQCKHPIPSICTAALHIFARKCNRPIHSISKSQKTDAML